MLVTYPKLSELDVTGKRVFLRLDLNTPIVTREGQRRVGDDTRIQAALPTIRHLLSAGARCIVASHLGRPKGKPNPEFSLEPVGQCLSELLETEIVLSEQVIGDGTLSLVQRLRPGQILLLENLRFHPGEESNSAELSQQLSKLTDVYINDAFGSMHRAHASTVGLPSIVKSKAIGFLVEKELSFLQPVKKNPKRPFAMVLGGAKVSDKIGILENCLGHTDVVVIGGAMAYAFLKAQGIEVGNSLCKAEEVALASRILATIQSKKIALHLPCDHVVANSIQDEQGELTAGPEIPMGKAGVDIGPKTLEQFANALTKVETIFWNGPMGVFESPAFSTGTFELAKKISECQAIKIVGGGDSASAVKKSGSQERFDFISTGGGATLEYLEGKNLPGLKVLEVFQ